MLSWFSNARISTKVLLATGALVVVVAATNYIVFVKLYRGDAKAALAQKADAFTAVADAAKSHASLLVESETYKTEELLTELKQDREAGKPYTESRIFNTIPVIVGLKAAKEAASREDIDFRVPALEPRNPENDPSADQVAGVFRREMLVELRDRVQAGDLSSLSRVNNSTNQVHVMRPIVLDASCMMCHGNAGHKQGDPDGDGIDPLGFPMEGWAEGDMHGAYEVVMPLDGLDQAVAGFVGWGLGFSVPVVIIGGLIFRFVLRNQVGGPLANTVNRMREIAEGDGDLTQRLPEKSKDEIGDLARAFNGFVGKIHDVIAAVVRDSTEMANQSTSLVASGKQTSSQLNASQMEGQQISAAAQELAASATEVSQRSTHAQEHSVRSGQLAGEGGSSVEQLVQEVEGISEAVSEAGETIERLAGRSSDIGSVIDVINEIADQTNLLALNAAIEAARAGEHGRGFAVVSDEVRKLADRTTAATEDISGLVKAIQEEANSAKERMTSSMDLVTSGRAKASSAGEGLSAILESTSGVRESVDSIAAAAEQQAAASDQVSESILKVVKTMTDAATTSDKLSAALESLSGKATRMRGEMNRFKLRDDRENGTGAGS